MGKSGAARSAPAVCACTTTSAYAPEACLRFRARVWSAWERLGVFAFNALDRKDSHGWEGRRAHNGRWTLFVWRWCSRVHVLV